LDKAQALYDESVRAQKAASDAADKSAKQAAEQAEKLREWQYKYDEIEAKKYLADTAAAVSVSSGAGDSGTSKPESVSSKSAVGSGGGSSGKVTKSASSLFEDMLDSANPFTFLSSNYSKYGIGSGAAATLDRVYKEYEAWLEEQSKPGGAAFIGDYTAAMYANYSTILDKLAVNSVINQQEPLDYVKRIEKSLGADYYIELMGRSLYDRFLSEVKSYADSYRLMINSENPAKWLESNGSKYSAEQRMWLNGKL
jgi:hypothetical protein